MTGFEHLNANQKEAVTWGDGPALVLAGPGSGKTAVLTLRTARLLQEQGDCAVLALTFTNKAATEMRERVDALMGQRADRAHLCTFHSFATEVLRQHAAHIGLKPDFGLLVQDDDRLPYLAEALAATPSVEIPGDRRSLLRLIDKLFSESYAEQLPAPFLTHTPSWLPELFRVYCDLLVRSNRLDFGALLHFTRVLLVTKPAVARAVRGAWTHICVDEFQDTNRAQYDLLRLLSPSKDANLFVVADDDQIIYQWNGASPERLQSIRDDYQMTVIQLPENYRCPPAIIELANSLIAHNKARSAGKHPLVARRAPVDGDHVWLRRTTDPAQEASQVAADIQARRLAPVDCVVLGRTRKVLEPVLEAMTAAGIPGHLPQQKADFEMPGTRWMFSVLRLGNARADRELLRLVCVAWDALTDTVVESEGVVADAALGGGDLLRAWCERATKTTTDQALVKLVGVVNDRLVERLDVLGMLEQFFWVAAQLWKDDLATQDELATWRMLNDEIRGEHGAESVTLNMYVQEMSLRSKTTPPPPGAVRLLTIHGSKGLEFKHVFLVGMAEEVFPSFQALKSGPSSRELEEERRSCFVAITRVQETLTISWAGQYYGYTKKPSRFLTEMGLELP